jgi:hypothetical protein
MRRLQLKGCETKFLQRHNQFICGAAILVKVPAGGLPSDGGALGRSQEIGNIPDLIGTR